MRNCNTILTEKLQKYQYYHQVKLIASGKEILPSVQSRIIEQANFTYSSFGKAFEKQIKTIEDCLIKQGEALKALKPEENKEPESTEGIFPKDTRTNEIKTEIYEIKK